MIEIIPTQVLPTLYHAVSGCITYNKAEPLVSSLRMMSNFASSGTVTPSSTTIFSGSAVLGAVEQKLGYAAPYISFFSIPLSLVDSVPEILSGGMNDSLEKIVDGMIPRLRDFRIKFRTKFNRIKKRVVYVSNRLILQQLHLFHLFVSSLKRND